MPDLGSLFRRSDRSLSIKANDRFYRGGGQAICVDRASRDLVRCARTHQQLPGHHAEWDEAGRIHADQCQVFPALGEDPAALQVLSDGAQELPPRSTMSSDPKEDR